MIDIVIGFYVVFWVCCIKVVDVFLMWIGVEGFLEVNNDVVINKIGVGDGLIFEVVVLVKWICEERLSFIWDVVLLDVFGELEI